MGKEEFNSNTLYRKHEKQGGMGDRIASIMNPFIIAIDSSHSFRVAVSQLFVMYFCFHSGNVLFPFPVILSSIRMAVRKRFRKPNQNRGLVWLWFLLLDVFR